MKRLFILLAGCGLLSFAQAQQTQQVVHIISSTLDQSAKETLNHMYISDTKVLSEAESGKDSSATLFDADEETLYIIDHNKKEYTPLTKEALERLGAMLSKQMAQLESQLEMLPEEQQEAIRKQMNQQKGAEINYEKAKTDVPVNQWRCTQYLGKTPEGTTQLELYLTDFSQAGLDADDLEGMTEMMKFLQEYMQDISKSMQGSMNLNIYTQDMPAYKEGIPVRMIWYDEQEKPFITNTITSIEEDELEEKRLKIPEGYKERTFDEI